MLFSARKQDVMPSASSWKLFTASQVKSAPRKDGAHEVGRTNTTSAHNRHGNRTARRDQHSPIPVRHLIYILGEVPLTCATGS